MLSLNNPQSMKLLNCLADNNDIELIVLEKNLNLSKAIDGLKIYKLEKYVGEIPTITAICYLINRFNSNFNVGKSLTPAQSALLASDIVEKYPYETIEDIVLMFKMVRQGTIGDGKDYKLDGQNVMTKWIPQYLDMKYEQLERDKKREVAEMNSMTSDNSVQIYYKKLREKKAAKEKDEQIRSDIDKMVLNMDMQMLEDTITDWSSKPEMKNYIDYLKRKRQVIK